MVAIVIPVHNRCDTTRQCLERLDAAGILSDPGFRLVIVDDGSTDGTPAVLAGYRDRIDVLTGDGSLWWTGATRMGMEHAARGGAEWVLWLNDDCASRGDAIARMIAFGEHGSYDIVAPVVITLPSGKPFTLPGKAVIGEVEGGRIIRYTPGYCVALHRRVWERIGFPDPERFPHYGGDVSYTEMATNAGLRIVALSSAVVEVHENQDRYWEVSRHCGGGDSWWSRLRTCLFEKRSIYYWRCTYYLCRLRRGIGLGTLEFAVKTIMLAWKTRTPGMRSSG